MAVKRVACGTRDFAAHRGPLHYFATEPAQGAKRIVADESRFLIANEPGQAMNEQATLTCMLARPWIEVLFVFFNWLPELELSADVVPL